MSPHILATPLFKRRLATLNWWSCDKLAVRRVDQKPLGETRGISLFEEAYEIPIETKEFLQDSYEYNRDSSWGFTRFQGVNCPSGKKGLRFCYAMTYHVTFVFRWRVLRGYDTSWLIIVLYDIRLQLAIKHGGWEVSMNCCYQFFCFVAALLG